MPEIFWSVDSLVIKDNVLYGFGWIFHARHEIKGLHFRLNFALNGETLIEDIVAYGGKPREDVAFAFANQPNALHSGYVVLGAFPAGGQISAITLVCSLIGGASLELAVPISRVIKVTGANKSKKTRFMFRQLHLLKRGVHLIRSGKLTTLFDKARTYLKKTPQKYLHKPTDLVALLSEGERINLCVMIDHDLGGGANLYRDRLVDSIVKDGRSMVILTYHLPSLSHVAIVMNHRLNLRFFVPNKDFILESVKELGVTDIIYNTAVSFAKPEEIPPLLINLKQATSACLKVLVHDFFLVCPSHFLMDYEGKYCDVPHINTCTSCLSKNKQEFTSLFLERDMPKWRSIWGSVLDYADQIVTFSDNSSKLLLKAYPQIDPARILIVRHKVTHLPDRMPKITNTYSLRIGVVGHIGFHKGSYFVQALAREIKRRDLDVKIVVIGSIETSCESLVVTQTGSYTHAVLPELIERTGVNVFLFSSICAETFSYVVEELVSMDLPIACFKLGAPSERLATYSKGRVLSSMDSGVVLDDLITFHRDIYLAN